MNALNRCTSFPGRVSRIFMLGLIFVVVTLAGCTDAETGDEPMENDVEPAENLSALDSEFVQSPFENAFARVYRIDLPPGDSIAPHDGGPRVVYSTGTYSLAFETNGEASTRSFESGAVHAHEAGVHVVSNTGDAPASYVVFERISDVDSVGPGDASTLEEVDIPSDTSHDVVLTNDAFTVHKISLAPGDALPEHFGFDRVVYALSDYTVTLTDPEDGSSMERSYQAGDVHDHEAGRHRVENNGSTPADYLVVAFKP